MSEKLKSILLIFLIDSYIILISFAVLKVIELMLKSFWTGEGQLFKIIDLTLSLPILCAYAFILFLDLSEYLFGNKT
ncbi:MAG: hypothetical protein OEV55_03990 [candidate division Zixibacteria bacterium]|nr:hypothetical protein [candidate division Zixibacteria bacterium]